MKTRYYIMIIAGVFSCLTYSCDKEQENTLSGNLVNHSGCKTFKSYIIPNTPDTLSCINYSFDPSNNKLTLNHINAGFNCCPESLYCDIKIINDTIIIQEFEKEALCDCDCLYDLEIELYGVFSKIYYLKIIEPYVGNQEKLFFQLDLESHNQGSYCVTRKRYPWGLY
ncbi:MAG: hypothetical protein U9N53_01705 [Bacteroidota bacterium]|nr:hypothetical protein [Bacteroidota bacterium]